MWIVLHYHLKFKQLCQIEKVNVQVYAGLKL